MGFDVVDHLDMKKEKYGDGLKKSYISLPKGEKRERKTVIHP